VVELPGLFSQTVRRTTTELARFAPILREIQAILAGPQFDKIPTADKELLLALLGTLKADLFAETGLTVLARCLGSTMLEQSIKTFQQEQP
jgi:hypothetical protein